MKLNWIFCFRRNLQDYICFVFLITILLPPIYSFISVLSFYIFYRYFPLCIPSSLASLSFETPSTSLNRYAIFPLSRARALSMSLSLSCSTSLSLLSSLSLPLFCYCFLSLLFSLSLSNTHTLKYWKVCNYEIVL